MKRALITGITGQDGSYLAELLLEKGYEVHGVIRLASSFNTGRIDHLYKDPHEDGNLHLHYGDVTDGGRMHALVAKIQPDEIYNLAAQSHVKASFDQPLYTAQVTALGAINMLEAIRHVCPTARFYQASSSELFGNAPPPQNEQTPFHPRSPYAAAKAHAHYAAVNYREAYGLHVSCGICFNHESPRRGETFVTRKITRAVGRIVAGTQQKLYLGNLDAMRDWGFAGDYVKAMWLMLQQDQPDDYVIATGIAIDVRTWLAHAFGPNLDWQDYVEIDPRYMRSTEVNLLRGDFSKARKSLGWEPSIMCGKLARMMTDADISLAWAEKGVACNFQTSS